MSYLRYASLLLVLLSSIANARNVDSDFSRCAKQALQGLANQETIVHINNPSNESRVMDHNYSSTLTEYRMRVINKLSGKGVGNVTCEIDQAGNIVTAKLD